MAFTNSRRGVAVAVALPPWSKSAFPKVDALLENEETRGSIKTAIRWSDGHTRSLTDALFLAMFPEQAERCAAFYAGTGPSLADVSSDDELLAYEARLVAAITYVRDHPNAADEPVVDWDAIRRNSDPVRRTAVQNDVVALLRKHGVSTETWGTGSAKTLGHLVSEVIEGETTLVEDEAGNLVRVVSILYVNVLFAAPNRTLRLREDRQVFADGRERRRTLEGSLAEKLKAGEEADDRAVSRALQEELGTSRVLKIADCGITLVEQDSPSFPGLRMRATHRHFDAMLHDASYRAEGYVERQHDKSTYFVWEVEP